MKLSEFIRANVDLIIEAWEQFAKETPPGRGLDTAALRDHAVGILHTIAADLDQAQSRQEQFAKSTGRGPINPLKTEAEMHGSARVTAGFNVNEAMSEFRALRASVIRLWSDRLQPPGQPSEELIRFNESVDQALAESLRGFTGDKERYMHLFDTLLSSSPDLNYIFYPDGTIIYANNAFAGRYGMSLCEITKKNLFSICVIGEQELRRQVAMLVESKTIYHGEIPCVPSATSATYEGLLIPVLDKDGKLDAIAATARDITERKRSEDRIRRNANYDSLTGLPNRSLFKDRLEREVQRSTRVDAALALLFIDLDGFKEINDRLGHAAGDELLRQAAQRIGACVRAMDTVARLGGDEFTVILAEVRKTSHVEIVAQQILDQLAKPYSILDSEVQVTGSIGITLFPQDARTLEDLIKNADQAMYAAKTAGRNRFGFFTVEMRNAAWARLKIIDELRRALPEQQLRVHYQPIVELASGHIVKAEAQLRWQHPESGLMYPAAFLCLAEETGLICDIGDWVQGVAEAQARQWSTLSARPFQISVNMSTAEFLGKSATQDHAGLDVPSDGISIEVKEEALLCNSPVVKQRLGMLQQAGIPLAVDNFGIGYASMAYLEKFDFAYLKIDQSFIHALTNTTDSRRFAESIIVMAHKLGLKVIAQGVETAGQKDWLQAAGCDYAQGYLFSVPLPSEDFEQLLIADVC